MNGKLHGTIAFVPSSITLQTDSAPKKNAIVFGVFMKIKKIQHCTEVGNDHF